MPIAGETRISKDGLSQATFDGQNWYERAADPNTIRQNNRSVDMQALGDRRAQMAADAINRKDYVDFMNLNKQAETGSYWDGGQGGGFFGLNPIPSGIRLAQMGGGSKAQLAQIASRIQAHSVPKGQGNPTPNERDLYAAGDVGLQNDEPTNNAIAKKNINRIDAVNRRFGYDEKWLSNHDDLLGANQGYATSLADQAAANQRDPAYGSAITAWTKQLGSPSAISPRGQSFDQFFADYQNRTRPTAAPQPQALSSNQSVMANARQSMAPASSPAKPLRYDIKGRAY